MTHFKSLRTGMAHFKKFEDRPWTLLPRKIPTEFPLSNNTTFVFQLVVMTPKKLSKEGWMTLPTILMEALLTIHLYH
jgi:hypothetical protein